MTILYALIFCRVTDINMILTTPLLYIKHLHPHLFEDAWAPPEACTWKIALKYKVKHILGDPGANSGGEGKSKRAEKYGTMKSKERREEPLGTLSYQTSSRQSPPFWLLIGVRKTQVFCHQSEARTAVGCSIVLSQIELVIS